MKVQTKCGGEEITNYVINFCNKETLYLCLPSIGWCCGGEIIADDGMECVAQWREPNPPSTPVVNTRLISIILVKTAPTPLTTAEYRDRYQGDSGPYNGGNLHIFKTIHSIWGDLVQI